jgi:exoribonuclease R
MGARTRKTYKIGDAVRVQVLRADTIDKKLEFTLV